ncbi:MAG TPA: hypothetical protein VL793_06210 [Patescibacteria group bacterium]|nr:hypothetical protein [Patescibacteria group bacterium]
METRTETPLHSDELHGAEKLLKELKLRIQQAEEIAVQRAKAADRVVREHPYPTIGVAFGLGLLLGFLVRRK